MIIEQVEDLIRSFKTNLSEEPTKLYISRSYLITLTQECFDFSLYTGTNHAELVSNVLGLEVIEKPDENILGIA